MKKTIIIFTGIFVFINLLSCNSTARKQEKLEAVRQDSIRMYNDSIENARMQDSVMRAQEAQRHEKQQRQWFIDDSLKYLSEPLIERKEAALLKPVLKKWLNFHKLDITQFKLMEKDSLDVGFLLSNMDTTSIHYAPIEDEFYDYLKLRSCYLFNLV